MILTVEQLITELSKYDGKLPVVITRGGNGHNYQVIPEEIKIIRNPYFPDCSVDEPGENEDCLRLALI